MKHHVFALFQTHVVAEAAAREIHLLDAPGHRISILMHRDRLDEADIGFTETHVWHGLSLGVLYGVGAGAVIGGLVGGPLGFLGAGPLAAAVFGAGTGGLLAGRLGTMRRLEQVRARWSRVERTTWGALLGRWHLPGWIRAVVDRLAWVRSDENLARRRAQGTGRRSPWREGAAVRVFRGSAGNPEPAAVREVPVQPDHEPGAAPVKRRGRSR